MEIPMLVYLKKVVIVEIMCESKDGIERPVSLQISEIEKIQVFLWQFLKPSIPTEEGVQLAGNDPVITSRLEACVRASDTDGEEYAWNQCHPRCSPSTVVVLLHWTTIYPWYQSPPAEHGWVVGTNSAYIFAMHWCHAAHRNSGGNHPSMMSKSTRRARAAIRAY